MNATFSQWLGRLFSKSHFPNHHKNGAHVQDGARQQKDKWTWAWWGKKRVCATVGLADWHLPVCRFTKASSTPRHDCNGETSHCGHCTRWSPCLMTVMSYNQNSGLIYGHTLNTTCINKSLAHLCDIGALLPMPSIAQGKMKKWSFWLSKTWPVTQFQNMSYLCCGFGYLPPPKKKWFIFLMWSISFNNSHCPN